MRFIAGIRHGDGAIRYITVYYSHGFGETIYEYLFGSTCTKDMAYRFSTKSEAINALNIYRLQSNDNLYPFVVEVEE